MFDTLFCVCVTEWVLWVDASQPIRTMLEGDGDARDGWEDLLPSIRNTNLLQVFLAVLPGHACSPPREAPYVSVRDRGRDKSERKGESFFFPLCLQGDCTSPQSSQILWSDLCIKIRTKRTCILVMSPHQSYESKCHKKMCRERTMQTFNTDSMALEESDLHTSRRKCFYFCFSTFKSHHHV